MAERKDSSWREVLQGIFSEHPEALRELVEAFLNELLRAEQSEYLRAGPYERTEERTDYRSGYRPRLIKTRLGTLELLVPQTRGGFTTSALERYQRSERALLSGIGEMALRGVSTRKVKAVTEAFFGFPVSAQTVSALGQRLDEELSAWRSRRLEEAYPYLVVDARYEKVRVARRVVSQGVLVVSGIDERGRRRVLDLRLADTESEASWREVFDALKARGLRGVRLVVSDHHGGLMEAIGRCFQGASWQRCQTHFIRNALKRVRPKERRGLAQALRRVFYAPDLERALADAESLVERLEGQQPALARWLEESIEECLTVFHFPPSHRKRLRTTNMLERLNKEIRRRTRVVEIFPSPEAAERLIGALVIDQDEQWLAGNRYLNVEDLEDWDNQQDEGLPTELHFAATG